MRTDPTRAEVRQTVRRGLAANETTAQCLDRIYVGMEVIQVVEGVGHSPLELLDWPTALIEGFQACDIVERQRSPGTRRNLPVEVGDAS